MTAHVRLTGTQALTALAAGAVIGTGVCVFFMLQRSLKKAFDDIFESNQTGAEEGGRPHEL